MRYIAVIFWALILGQALNFLLSALEPSPFVLNNGFIMSAIIAIVCFIIASFIPDGKKN